MPSTTMQTSHVPTEFHRFPDLPIELREEIWTLCLPHPRACEVDVPHEEAAFDLEIYDDPSPCHLEHTTWINRSPPLITRVCREAQKVAHRFGKVATFWEDNQPFDPTTLDPFRVPGMNRSLWHDDTYDRVHMNWVPRLDSTSMSHASDEPLEGLVGRLRQPTVRASVLSLFWGLGRRSTTPASMGGALMALRNHTTLRPKEAHEVASLKKVADWLVVMRVIVVHCDAQTAARTALFGRGGDARVQVVDVAEQDLIEALFRLAENCEKSIPAVKVPQDFSRDGFWGNDAVVLRLKERILGEYCDEELAETMRPAVMFRLCTQQCNDALMEAERDRVHAEEERKQENARGRGGRGRGRDRGRGKGSSNNPESRRRVWERLQTSV